ncbi:hypothetical protein CEXT_454391 [Caerostris extrusa]|uniref:Uncharacterized protein n=1 Tax=Caerostris extrusa TaxID=172846 RepID=A0AAV4MYF6_CAEEX|nr:hypothetical protein CEXT_454391 [Caerostris extrusa]
MASDGDSGAGHAHAHTTPNHESVPCALHQLDMRRCRRVISFWDPPKDSFLRAPEKKRIARVVLLVVPLIGKSAFGSCRVVEKGIYLRVPPSKPIRSFRDVGH